jgi:DNA-binding MurR/RpiR family transcriptional regulator
MFRERVRRAYPRLSPNKRKVADFLMESHRDVAFMTASQLARRLEVDVATVVRFAQDIGYAGYPALAREIQGLVRGELKAAHGFAAGRAMAEKSPFIAIMLKERENIEQSLMNIPVDTVHQVIATLKAAKNIYVVAQGEAQDLARFFVSGLQLQGLRAETLSGDSVALALTLSKLTPDDVVVGLSHSQFAVETAGALRFADEQGAKTVGLVGTHASPVAHVAESVILCSSKSIAPVPSFGAIVSVMDTILQMLALEHPEKAAEHQATFERVYVELVEGQRESFVAIEKEVTRSE